MSEVWDFTLDLYSAEGVPVAFLELQDSNSADATLLVFLLFLAARGAASSKADIIAMQNAVAPWRQSVVMKLRAIRRDMKPGIAPVGATAAAALRDGVKRLELEAERLQLEVLAAEFSAAGDGAVEALARDSLAAYAAVNGTLNAIAVERLVTSVADRTRSRSPRRPA